MASPAQGMMVASAPVAWVVNESRTSLKGSVTPIDTATNTIVRKITIPLPPLDVVITPGGRTAYVSTDGSGAGRRGYVYPVSTATGKVGKRIPVGVFSAVMAVTPNGKTLYVLNEQSNTVSPISTATNTAGRPIRVAPRHGGDEIATITPDGSTVYVAGDFGAIGKGFIVPVSTATGAVGKTIRVHGLPEVMAATPDGNTLYVLCAGEPELGVPQDVIPVSTATNTSGRAINTGLEPIAIAITTGHQR